jgi:hypothetical protein
MSPMPWLQRWNFIERARLERELWDAFERAEDIDALVEQLRRQLTAGPSEPAAAFRLEVWETTLGRIRRIETLMQGKGPTGPER